MARESRDSEHTSCAYLPLCFACLVNKNGTRDACAQSIAPSHRPIVLVGDALYWRQIAHRDIEGSCEAEDGEDVGTVSKSCHGVMVIGSINRIVYAVTTVTIRTSCDTPRN